eukprot:1697867-Rhodomonas_salina.1
MYASSSDRSWYRRLPKSVLCQHLSSSSAASAFACMSTPLLSSILVWAFTQIARVGLICLAAASTSSGFPAPLALGTGNGHGGTAGTACSATHLVPGAGP